MSEYTENEPKDLRQAPDNKAGMPFLIIFLAVAIIAVLSISHGEISPAITSRITRFLPTFFPTP